MSPTNISKPPTHRVAISNARLLDVRTDVEVGQVTFRYKDYADEQRSKAMTVSADEFLRRFVQHVLPRGFVKIRHYGLLANRHREEKLTLCRQLLLPIAVMGPAAALPGSAAEPDAPSPASPQRCPQCGGCRLLRLELLKQPMDIKPLPAETVAPAAAIADTS